jgi:hypothetical protein
MNLTKPRLDQFKITGSTVGDLYFPQTKLLLPFDGANGATTTSDLSNANATVTFNGNSQISTAQSKFGGSSLYFNGPAGDDVILPASSAYLFSADFTIEMWFYMVALNTYSVLYATYAGSTAGSIEIQIRSAIGNKIRTWYNSGGAFDSNTSISTGQWYHWALTRSGTTVTYWLNGVSDGTMTLSGDMGRSNSDLYFGSWNSSTSYVFNGYIDDIRVTNGVARYTSTFTPPTTAHLTSAGDINKHIVVNSTADGVAIGTGGINQARIAKAWVNFDGTGTIAIRESYNVSSLTDHATGDYTVTFSTAMTDANYVMAGSALHSTWSYSGDNSHRLPMPQKDGYLASSIRVFTKYGHHTGSGQEDENIVNVIIFGN